MRSQLAERNCSILEDYTVKAPEVEVVSQLRLCVRLQRHNLKCTCVIGGQLSRHDCNSVHVIVGLFRGEVSGRHDVVDRLLPCPVESVQPRIDDHASSWPASTHNGSLLD